LAILGKNKEAEELALAIKENPHLGYRFFNFLDSKKDFIKELEKEKIEVLVLAENIFNNQSLINLLYQSLPLRLEIFDLSQFYEFVFEKVPVSAINQIWFLENLKERKKEFYEKTKRIVDFLLAFFLLFFTFPFWPLIILAIKLEDKGRVFYLQERVGKDKKIFKLIKFRSMIEKAEKNGPQWAESEDQRVTKVGRFLRKTHLDEIPQLINILKGDIALVGPRPERPEFVHQLEKEIPHYHLRHIIKPGFTGWAQIKFRYARSVMDSFEKFQYDLFYIKNRSFFLDFRILLKTFQLFFKKEKQ
jgi:exopolysaccharide biosynthesis polyprenyl glycosylphosphotransferase